MEALVTLGAPGFCAVVYLFVMIAVVIHRAGIGAEESPRALTTGLLAAYAGFHVWLFDIIRRSRSDGLVWF